MALTSACAAVQVKQIPVRSETLSVTSLCTTSSQIAAVRTLPFSSQSPLCSSLTVVRSDALCCQWKSTKAFERLLSVQRCRHVSVTRSQVAVDLGGSPSSEHKAGVGNRIKVTVPLKVYHVPKVPEFNLEGLEGEVKEVLGQWKGKPVSANLPLKVQFETEVDGKTTKFVAHLKDDEFEVL
eukprot:TRINITY_DN38422_c0_g1_i1.p1 TRINITY_DN38422_c0_g1~~TRINITY_DN38422_c0_g1_i1.p1  ORF type:complete len:181 (+),score=14.80 TRINITY_DN38422_c0_g1_i1:74-616(+)